MRVRGLLVLMLGVSVAGTAVVAAHQMLAQAAKPPEAAPVDLAQVVVARGDMAFGALIQPEMVRLQPWPREAVPPDAFRTLDEVIGVAGSSERRRVRRALAAGEVILTSKVSGFGEKVTIADIIDPKKRALAIRVNDVTGVAGFLTPGDRVDIVLTRQIDRDYRADTILQNIKIRGVDQVADEDRDKPAVVRTVTVEVDPPEAQKLVLAQQAGTLSLALRSLDNVERANVPPIRLEDLGAERKATARSGATVSVNRAGQRAQVALPES
jgi:pilus assembly protein CpaB